jgi:hypothetical protein
VSPAAERTKVRIEPLEFTSIQTGDLVEARQPVRLEDRRELWPDALQPLEVVP